MADPANHIFLPWVAPGMAATLPDSATERLATDQQATVSVTVGFLVNGTPVSKTARLHGPGDIAGIDPLQIVRVEPRPATPDFEPNYFPLIEFDRPDFPWLLSPLKADGQGRLRPWLCLVVVRKQPGVVLRPATTQGRTRWASPAAGRRRPRSGTRAAVRTRRRLRARVPTTSKCSERRMPSASAWAHDRSRVS